MLFITKYNEGVNSFGGMVRVKDIEKLISKCEFLTVKFEKPFAYAKKRNSNNNIVHEVGFLRFVIIFKLLQQASSLYFHTVGNFIKVSVLLPFVCNKNWFIDLHGAQPEEFKYMGNYVFSILFRFFEKLAFINCDYYIHVSRNMEKHFKKLYPKSKGLHIYAPILSPNIDVNKSIDLAYQSKVARYKLGIPECKNVFLYSGGIQPWQKVDEIIEYTKKVISNDGFVIILSGQHEYFVSNLKSLLSSNCLIVKSVLPEQLSDYYTAANYGIMFRDDNVLNMVSSPTKMSEYLFYGMYPVMTSLKVGDFVSLGIEYITSLDPIDIKLPPVSQINHDIMCGLIKNSDFELLKEKISAY
jgi:glycosyltransferase involved in cell wall biosynthesis